MKASLQLFEPVVDLFLAGKLTHLNHARHLAVARIFKRMPHGHALLHLGLQVTATRAGVPQKYSREITDFYWERLDDIPPTLADFADVLS